LQTKIPSEFRTKVPAVKSELLKYINDDEMTEHVKLIVQYILHLLEYDYEEMKNIKDSTFKGYIGLLDKHLFKKIEDLADVQEHELNEFLTTLERFDYKHKSINKIRSLISRFFMFNNDEQRLQRVNISSYPKSLIFAHEIDGILSHIDTVTIGGAKRVGSTYKFKLLQMQALLLLGFYTGLRKTELRSRLLSDFYIYGDKLCMDVNKDGLKKIGKSLKTKNSKRRVCFSISDAKHFSIVKEFLETRKSIKNKSQFLFLEISDDNIVRSKVIDDAVFDEITQILQGFTSRYVSFHSLRHSYASYEVKKIIDDVYCDSQQLLDLAVRIGHEAPDITLKVYVHRSVLEMGGV
jgi:integrase